MANYDLKAVMARLPSLEKAALAALSPAVTCDAVDYWPYAQDGFPYWWNRVESMALEQLSGDLDIHRYQISMALVIGHLGSDAFKGEHTQNAYAWIAGVLNYFRGETPRHLYDGTVYTSAPDWLWIEQGGAVITGIPNGTRTLANSGIAGTQQVAVVFTLDIPLLFELY